MQPQPLSHESKIIDLTLYLPHSTPQTAIPCSPKPAQRDGALGRTVANCLEWLATITLVVTCVALCAQILL